MKNIERSIASDIKKDLKKKLVILVGPRQCGKTTLAREIVGDCDYLNFDIQEDKANLLKLQWDRKKDLIIFDEIHKMPRWKSWLKGIVDKEKNNPAIMVTGSARLDALKKTGDSLAGRHYYYRLHPFDAKEITESKLEIKPDILLKRLMDVGGYPEPFLANDIHEYRRWRKTHIDLIIKQDLVDLEIVRDLKSIQLLIELLRSRVGSSISANSLAIDLQKDPKTIQKWLGILEDLFIIFKVTPYSKDISRSLKKEPKYYFYDCALVDGDEGVKLENIVACSLLKETHRLLDAKGIAFNLNYLKVKGGREIDFALVPEEKDIRPLMIEVKWGQTDASPNFKLFESAFKRPRKIQIVQTLKKDFSTATGVEVCKASQWLCDFALC